MFITLEGIEGAGKTTQVEFIVSFLKARGYETLITREPGGTRVGSQIRSVLLNPENSEIAPLTELLLYTADRVQHVTELVRPALEAGKIVLCDRYVDATIVYQGYARGLDIGLIATLHQLMLDDLKPDLTILFDLGPEQGLERAWRQINAGARTGDETRFENETLSFHEKVRAGYLERSRLEPERFRVVDASKNADAVREATLRILADELPPR